jgi:hypothetical protein
MSARAIAAILVFLAMPPLSAQQEKSPPRHARFLALGESPPFRQEIRDGVRYELDPPPGSVPPREIVVGFGGEEETAAELPLRLGFITGRVEVPAGEGTIGLRGGDGAPWVTVKRPASGDFMVYLFRGTGAKTWNEVSSLVVADGSGTPAGKVRITNLFPQSVRVVWGTEASVLGSGKSMLRDARPGSEVAFQILVRDEAGGLRRYFSGGVNQNPGERGWLTIYRADGESPRRPLKVSMLREPVVPNAPEPVEKP